MAGPIRISILADAGKAKSEIGEVDSKLSRLARGGMRLAGAGALALGAGTVALGAGLLTLAKGAAEDDAAQRTLAKTLKNTTRATDEQVAALEDYISKTGVATGVTDDEMRPALANLLRATKDQTKAQKLMDLALNVSAGTGKDLGAVTTALAKAQLGSTGALAKLGIATKDASGKALSFDKIQKNLAKTFAGQSATAADTLTGKYARARLVLAELGETVGAKALPLLTKLSTWILEKGVPAAEKLGTWVDTKLIPKLSKLSDEIVPKVKTAVDDLQTLWKDNKDEVGELVTELQDLATSIDTKVVPALQRLGPPLQTLSKIDLRGTTNSLRAVNTLLSKGDGTATGPTGVLAKLQSLGTIAAQVNPAQKLAQIAQQAVLKFGDVFVKDATVRAKVAGWLGRNFGNVAGLLPMGTLQRVGVLAADAIARGFGAQNPAGTVARWMVNLGRYAIQYNPVAVAQSVGRRFNAAIDQGILGGQATVLGRVRSLAKNIGSALISSLPFGAVYANALKLGGRTMDGVRNGLSSGIGGVLAIIRSMPSRLASAGGNWGSALFGAGQDIVRGLVNGIRSMAGAAASAAAQIASDAINAAKSKLGIKSPSKVFMTLGQQVGQGLADGLSDDAAIKRAASDLASTVVDSFGRPTVPLPTVAMVDAGVSRVGAGAGAAPVIINVYALQDGPDVGRRVVDAIKDYETFNGTGWRSAP
ncbi:MAG TPA: hypothetical protein VIQ30_11000 [Pseudonocardia sp.]